MMAHSLVQCLHQRQPAPMVDVLAPAWSLPLLARMPGVRQGLPLLLGHGEWGWGQRRRLGQQLRGQYQQAIVLPNSFKSALIPYWAGIPQRTGFTGEFRHILLNDRRALDKNRWPLLVQRFVALGVPAQTPLPPILPPVLEPQDPTTTLTRLNLTRPAQPVLALCPGAEYGPAKRWPVSAYAAVARHALSQGLNVWIFGSGKDSAIGAALAAQAPGCVDLCGRTALAEAVDLLALASVVVSNDSGLMHVAAALGRPVVALYGSSDPGYTPPLTAYARILRDSPPCAPCFQRTCRFGHYDCLTRLSVAQVQTAVTTLLSR